MQRVGFVLIAVLLASCASAQPPARMFRGGAARLGVFPGPAAQELKPVWRFQTQGALVSSPVVAGGLVYVGSGDGHLYALAARNGALWWKARTGGEVNGSPAVQDGRVYVVSADGGLHAYDAASGAPLWTFRTAGEHRYTKPGVLGMEPASEMMPDPWDFYLSSPAVVDGLVIFGSGDGQVYAVDAITGTKRWAFQTGDVVHASPAVAGGKVYIGSWDGRFYALELATGRPVWVFATGLDPKDHLMTGIAGSAAVADGRVYFGSRDAHVYALDAGTGALLWSHPTGLSWVEASPAVLNGVVYIPTSDSTRFLALDAATGASVYELPTGIYAFSSPAIAGGHAYFGTFDGRLHDVDLAKRAYAGEFDAPGLAQNGPHWLDANGRLKMDAVWTGPTLDDSIVGIRSRLFSMGSILSSPAVADGEVFVGSVDGTLYALR